MKFLAIAALIATTSAAVGEDCGADGTQGVCEDTECCGTATPDEDSDATDAITICQTDSLEEYANSEAETETYTFACNTAEEGNATKLIASATLAIASAYLM